ncbi:MAG: hypothetical protein RIC03_16275 [Cyclobacteriaceae bacterium]
MAILNSTQKITTAILLGTLIILFACERNNKQVQVTKSMAFEKGGNVYILYPDSTTKQLTFTNQDYAPTYLDRYNWVLFSRYSESNKKVVLVRESTLEEVVILDSVRSLREMTISEDENWMMFINDNTLISVHLSDLQVSDFGSVSSFILTNDEPYKNHCIKIDIKEKLNERNLELSLIDSIGRIKKEFQNADNLKSFVKQNVAESLGDLMRKLELVNQRLVMMDSLDHRKERIQKLDYELENTGYELKKAYTRLSSINKFKLGRSITEKEKQLNDQRKLIDFIENKLRTLKDKHNLELKDYFNLERKLTNI